jgi:hypothetical protein
MAGKPQTLSDGQKREVVSVLRKEVLAGILFGLAVLTGVTGVGLWQIKQRVQSKMEQLVAKQFEEPRIQQVVRDVAADRASTLILEQINPEVARFKAEVASQLTELQVLVAKTRELEVQSRQHEQAMQAILAALQQSLNQSHDAQARLSSVKSDVVEMQKCIAAIQYYQLKGRNTFPNPYGKEMFEALNKLTAIAIPDPAERSRFITKIQGPQEKK